jgi:hypothetical protein
MTEKRLGLPEQNSPESFEARARARARAESGEDRCMFIVFVDAPKRQDDEPFVPFVRPESSNHAVGNGQEWFREPGETEEQFMQRIEDSLPLRSFCVGLETLKEGDENRMEPIGFWGVKAEVVRTEERDA